jgi:hypothetical protein
MATKHGLITKAGIQEKKIKELEAQLAVSPKSAGGESVKEAVRTLISMLVGSAVAMLWSQYGFLSQIFPDSTPVVFIVTTLLVRAADKYIFQEKKNKGEVGVGIGIDYIFVTFANLFNRAKTQPVQIEENKK